MTMTGNEGGTREPAGGEAPTKSPTNCSGGVLAVEALVADVESRR